MYESEQERYNAIVGRISKVYEARTQFVAHVIAFIVGATLGLYIIPNTDFWFFAAGVWLIGLLVHAVNWGFFEMRERAIQRELERAGLYDPDRRKRDHMRLVQLSEDGEITDISDDPFAGDEDAPRRQLHR